MEKKTNQESVQRSVEQGQHVEQQHAEQPPNPEPHLDEAKQEAGRAADAAYNSAAEAGKAAKGSLTMAGEAVVNLVKSHLPRVEHEEETEEERRSKALLDEAMGRGDESGGTEVVVPATEGVIAEENKPLGGALVEEAQREAAEARDYLIGTTANKSRVHEYRALPGDVHIPLVKKAIREHVLHQRQDLGDQHPTTGGATTETEQPTTAERAYYAVVDPMKDAVQTIKDDASWAYQHTREELFDKTARQTREEMEPKTGGEWERAHGGIPSSTTEQVLQGVTPTVQDSH